MKQLSNEIVLLILEKLKDRKDIFSFLRTCHYFYSLIQDDLFWRDLIRTCYNIKYKTPDQTWWSLFESGDVTRMCSHIQHYDIKEYCHQKRILLWKTFENLNQFCCENTLYSDNYGLCMEPGCQFVGCGDVFFSLDESFPGHLRHHHNTTGHSIILKLSPLNFMELWCYSCNHAIGYWGFPHSIPKPLAEQFICRQTLDFMTKLPSINRNVVLHKRRFVEQKLSFFQPNHDFTFLIEKQWFTEWMDFLKGDSDCLPGALDNSKLFIPHSNGVLRHDLIIGYDYELVGRSIKSYIERVYGLLNDSIIVSGDDYTGKPLYRGIAQSILLHRHFISSST